MLTPAAGEEAAVGGFKWQYDQIARLVYEAVVDGLLDSFRLTDPEAGKADDLVLVRDGRTDAYQFRSGEGTVTFRSITRAQKGHGGSELPPLIRTLADAWRSLGGCEGQVHVHYFAEMPPSTHDHIVPADRDDRPTRNHFKGFLAEVLEPLRTGRKSPDEIAKSWRATLDTFREQSGVSAEEFLPFLQSLHFDLNARPGTETPIPSQRGDLVDLSNRLYRLASEVGGVVERDAAQLLRLMGWQDRTRLLSTDRFHIDLATYEPLADAMEKLKVTLEGRDRGYVAVVGPPGTGKSTLLTQMTFATTDRVIRYYAHIPGAAERRNRLAGRSFLHDVVLKLKESGLEGVHRELTSEDPNELRRQRAELFDSSHQEFIESGRRTIIVVDGLDHVEREYPGNDGLLAELPRVDELPDGVILIAGTRMVSPLGPDVRQSLTESGAVIDLAQYPLSPPVVRAICARAPGVSSFGDKVHQLIVERSAGHPLSLSYLLNRIRDEQADSAQAILESTPAYSGDIAATYRAIWDDVEQDDALVQIFSACSRLRIGFRAEWVDLILEGVPLSLAKAQRFTRDFRYLFRIENEEWRFFHDSFRQFADERTALGPNGAPDPRADASAHEQVANLCAGSDDLRLAAEELHHRFLAGQEDAVLSLAGQSTWRQQFQDSRSSSLIQRDIELVLQLAAARGDAQGMLKAILGLAELQSRISVLEGFDLPQALYEAGLVAEALQWCSGRNPAVLLAHRYNLAATLGRDGIAAGQRLFDANEHFGLDEPSDELVSGHLHDAAVAWVRAAALFRPVSSVLQQIEHVIEFGEDSVRQQRHLPEDEYWDRYFLMLQELIESTRSNGDSSGLVAIDEVLEQRLASLESSADQGSIKGDNRLGRSSLHQLFASTVALRVRIAIAISALAHDPTPVARGLAVFLSESKSRPLFGHSLLDGAELLADSGLGEAAVGLLGRADLAKSFTAGDLSYDLRKESADDRFRFWRLQYRLAPDATTVPDSIPPSAQTPAGDDIPQDALLHGDTEAISFAERVDVLVRDLARIDAESLRGTKESAERVWAVVLRAIDVVPASGSRASSSRSVFPLRAPELLVTATNVAAKFGEGLPQRLSEELCDRFREHPVRWLATPLLDVLHDLRSAGVEVEWEREVLAAHEGSATEDNVHMKTEQMAELIPRYRAAGYPEKAIELARRLPAVAFAVGFRKDDQFDEWIDWYGEAARTPNGLQLLADGSWLARLVSAVDRMTEGAPGRAAIELPGAIAPQDSFAAVRVFEYLVRNGTVPHFSALAAVVRALLGQTGVGNSKAIALAADITTHLVAGGAQHAYPDLANTVVAAQRVTMGQQVARELALSMATLTDRLALPTAREEWRQGLGLVPGTKQARSNDRYNDLVLLDGQRIAKSDAMARMGTADDVVAKREEESSDSRFPWRQAIAQLDLSSDQIKQIAPLFQVEDERDLDVQVVLAEAAERTGDQKLGYSMAKAAFRQARRNSWTRYSGNARLRCAAIRVRLGESDERVEVCQDLARDIVGNPLLVRQLIYDLRKVVETLMPELSADETWPLVRDYLEGMAEPLELGSDDPFEDHGSRWWSPERYADDRESPATSSARGALAELAVGHLSHPSWIVSDAAGTIVVNALGRGDEDVAQALARFAGPETSHDLLEKAGRCLAVAKTRYATEAPPCLDSLDHTLANHRSQVLRDLTTETRRRVSRALEPSYELVVPSPALSADGQALATNDPYGPAYRVLADLTGFEESAVARVAGRLAKEELRHLPSDAGIQSALSTAGVRHRYPRPEIAARRAAFGRVLADFQDAGALDGVPTRVRRMLRTVDIDLVGAIPEARPDAFPKPPAAGHEQRAKKWIDNTEERIEEYVSASVTSQRTLIGARVDLGVLNWGHLEEEYLCGTTVGIDVQESPEFLLEPRHSMLTRDLKVLSVPNRINLGDPLVIENSPYRFQQLQAHWLAFRPDLATALGWTPDELQPGTWYTASGEIAVESVWWVDGWWSHTGRAFDDTVATGHAVLLSAVGRTAMITALGAAARHFRLTRTASEDGTEHGPRVVTRQLAMK